MQPESSKSTILIISMGFLALYFIYSWRWLVIASFLVGVAGILSPFLSRKIEWGWIKIGQAFGYVVPNVVLSIVFFIFLFPLALLSRRFQKDPLLLSRKYDSYFLTPDKKIDKKSFEKTW